MRIAVGIFRLSPRGGLEDHALRIASALAGRGHEVVIHTTGTIPETNVAAVSLEPGRALTNHGRMAAFAAAFQRAAAKRFDRIVGFQPMPGLDVLFVADHLRSRPESSLIKRLSPRYRAYARLEEACFGARSHTRIMTLARPQAAAFAQRYPKSAERIAILPPTILEARRHPELRAPETRAAVRERLGIGLDEPVWLWLGLQPRVKGLDRAVEALAMVPQAKLLVGGIGSRDTKAAPIAERAKKLGVGGRMRWLGYLPADAVLEHFAAADVLAHPARVDVTGAVILEALINGLPVVATDVCGFAPHIGRAGAGMVLGSPCDQRGLADALVRACGPDNAAFSLNGIEYGRSPALYSGIDVACELIEAETWPREITVAANGRTTAADGKAGR